MRPPSCSSRGATVANQLFIPSCMAEGSNYCDVDHSEIDKRSHWPHPSVQGDCTAGPNFSSTHEAVDCSFSDLGGADWLGDGADIESSTDSDRIKWFPKWGISSFYASVSDFRRSLSSTLRSAYLNECTSNVQFWKYVQDFHQVLALSW